MNDLIQITQTTINGAETNSVYIKELVEVLGVLSHPSQWFGRHITNYGFIENEDFLLIKNEKQSGSGGHNSFDYVVTLDTAKELAMLCNNEKGREVRKYFIEVEKKSKKVFTTSEQIALLAQGHQEVENRLIKLESTKRLENWQERTLTDEKNKIVYQIAKDDKEFATKLHRKVWSLFKKHFHLARYNELAAVKFDDGVVYIRNLTLADMV